jgi:hypothetical protein
MQIFAALKNLHFWEKRNIHLPKEDLKNLGENRNLTAVRQAIWWRREKLALYFKQ